MNSSAETNDNQGLALPNVFRAPNYSVGYVMCTLRKNLVNEFISVAIIEKGVRLRVGHWEFAPCSLWLWTSEASAEPLIDVSVVL